MEKFPVAGFKWVENTSQFNKNFKKKKKKCSDDSDEEYFLESDFKCYEKLHDLNNDSPFLPERIKN